MEEPFWKRRWTCRQTDYWMNEYWCIRWCDIKWLFLFVYNIFSKFENRSYNASRVICTVLLFWKMVSCIRACSNCAVWNNVDVRVKLTVTSDMIYLLTVIGLPAGGSSTVHIYTQTIHRTTQLIWEECGPCPVFASYTLAFDFQLRKKHGKTLG